MRFKSPLTLKQNGAVALGSETLQAQLGLSGVRLTSVVPLGQRQGSPCAGGSAGKQNRCRS